MTNRVVLPPQDFQRMCKQAERDQESRKLLVLIERVKRQIAEQENRKQGAPPVQVETAEIRAESRWPRIPSRSVPFER